MKGSKGDKMRIIFTISDLNQALLCYNLFAKGKDSPIKDNSIMIKIYYLLAGKDLLLIICRKRLHELRGCRGSCLPQNGGRIASQKTVKSPG